MAIRTYTKTVFVSKGSVFSGGSNLLLAPRSGCDKDAKNIMLGQERSCRYERF